MTIVLAAGMKRSTAIRLILFLSVSDVVFGLFNAFTSYPLPAVASFLAVACALVMVIWSSVLLAYNNKPASSHCLCRFAAHAISMTVFAPIWFILAILLSTNTSTNCAVDLRFDYNAFGCGFSAAATVGAWLLCAATTATSIFLWQKGKIAGLEANVTSLDVTKDLLYV
ncbi:unnamed protein product [Somion occarium]|uniref:MARVEL domain-containing protein n=1 Tax=Somion occarium TaxID=3059160 RepID=A0ABP1D171_9APHY